MVLQVHGGPPQTGLSTSGESQPFLPDVDSMDVDDPAAFGLLDGHDGPTEEVDTDFFNDFPDDFDDEDLA